MSDIKLPQLPTAYAPTAIGEDMQAYAREAILADRAQRGEPVAWIPPVRDFEFHHDHESITAYRSPMSGWVPVYLAPQPDGRDAEIDRAVAAERERWQDAVMLELDSNGHAHAIVAAATAKKEG